mgnify:CR=1 FL=1
MVLSDLKDKVKNFEKETIIARQMKTSVENDVVALNKKCNHIEDENLTLTKAIDILTHAANTSRDNARAHFEKIVTDALQFVTQSTDYEFIIKDLPSRSKASYEFYIKSTVNGVECVQKPEDANGGGFVDIISVALKYAYLEIFNDPKICSGTLFFDEPGKMISEQMSIKFAEYLKFLGNHYNRQTIMITHNNNLSSVANKTFNVSKNVNGISQVSVPSDTVTMKELEDEVEELFQ